ncbi:unnamed protein product [Closterium sp. Naga37s-1]|nr:unnamed protein product [Closterium sp. Naga37s-1]
MRTRSCSRITYLHDLPRLPSPSSLPSFPFFCTFLPLLPYLPSPSALPSSGDVPHLLSPSAFPYFPFCLTFLPLLPYLPSPSAHYRPCPLPSLPFPHCQHLPSRAASNSHAAYTSPALHPIFCCLSHNFPQSHLSSLFVILFSRLLPKGMYSLPLPTSNPTPFHPPSFPTPLHSFPPAALDFLPCLPSVSPLPSSSLHFPPQSTPFQPIPFVHFPHLPFLTVSALLFPIHSRLSASVTTPYTPSAPSLPSLSHMLPSHCFPHETAPFRSFPPVPFLRLHFPFGSFGSLTFSCLRSQACPPSKPFQVSAPTSFSSPAAPIFQQRSPALWVGSIVDECLHMCPLSLAF